MEMQSEGQGGKGGTGGEGGRGRRGGRGGLECSAMSGACAEAMPTRRPEAGPGGGGEIGGEE
jgi:hypothetical protein